MDDSRSEIQSFYANKTIFITGATGFMGKVLMEKLLYSCSDLDKIYILIRAKKGRTPQNRLEEIFKLPLYVRVQKEKPHMFKKVIPLNGDMSLEHLGLTDKQQLMLMDEVNVVFHCAATLRLEAKLKTAIEMNLTGTKKILDLAKQMKHLLVFLHLSTAFCHVDQIELGEHVYDSIHEPEDLIRLTQWLDESEIDRLTPKVLVPHPNTYTFTKRLAERLVAKAYPDITCVIARPSIVTPAVLEPVVGWVDNLNGPTGLLVGAGKGVIRSMHCNSEYHAEVIPVDFAINAMISIAYTTANAEKSKSIPVYNVTQSGALPITWGEIVKIGREIIYDYPFEGQVWYPDGDIRNSRFIHNIFVFLFHILPAYFIDFLMLLFRQPRFMVKIQKRISNGLNVLQYFTTREWKFHNNKMLSMCSNLSLKDQKIFQVDFKLIGMHSYLKTIILGTRQYCMKEDLSSLPRARRHQKVLYIIHLITIYMFYFGLFYNIYKHFSIMGYCLDYTAEKIKSVPFIGGLIKNV